VAKLRDATVAATKTADVQKSLDIEGAVIIGNTPEEFGAFMQGESQRWATLIAETGITID
jgi:tripartite-type tricarboxylate transporter receptor subunit TctC